MKSLSMKSKRKVHFHDFSGNIAILLMPENKWANPPLLDSTPLSIARWPLCNTV